MGSKLRNKLVVGSLLWIATGPAAAGNDPAQDDWPQWRGPTRDAKVTTTRPWPSTLENSRERWRVPLGPSYSGPIVWGNRIFVTETKNKETEAVRALDRTTGSELWKASWTGAISVPFFAKSNGSWIRSTPACDGESLFVAGIRDVLVCLDVATGAKRWEFDFPERLGTAIPAFGCVSSPLLVGEFVFVQAGGGFAKLHKRTGELIWHVLDGGEGMDSAFSSPILAKVSDSTQFLVQMRDELAGVRPADGHVLWRQKVPAYRGMNILTPTVHGNGILTSTYKNKTFFYSLTNQGGSFTSHETWKSSAQGYMSSPVVIGEHVYLHLGNGRFCCIDLRDGQETWRSKPFGKYWSMAVSGNRILALDERGQLLLIEANPDEFRLLDRKSVSDEECWAHIAVSGADVLVRDLAGLTLFDWQPQTSPTPES